MQPDRIAETATDENKIMNNLRKTVTSPTVLSPGRAAGHYTMYTVTSDTTVT